MKKQLILHIPHADITIPDKTGYLISDEQLKNEQLVLTDWYTDELYDTGKDVIVKAEFSRFFCDAERFEDDSRESMSKIGMGVLYTKTVNQDLMREYDDEFKERVLDAYYRPHHQRLTSAVAQQLDSGGKGLIVDCHSFPDNAFTRRLLKGDLMPDFSIGIDAYHTPQELIDYSLNFFREKGHSITIDDPFSGTMVPMAYYKKDKRVSSIMLEINRWLYLQGDTNLKSDGFEETQRLVAGFLDGIRALVYDLDGGM